MDGPEVSLKGLVLGLSDPGVSMRDKGFLSFSEGKFTWQEMGFASALPRSDTPPGTSRDRNANRSMQLTPGRTAARMDPYRGEGAVSGCFVPTEAQVFGTPRTPRGVVGWKSCAAITQAFS